MTQFIDIADFPEDNRIDMIAHRVRDHGEIVAFIVDDVPGKKERYIAKLKSRYPTITIIDELPGPVAGTITVKVGPSPASQS